MFPTFGDPSGSLSHVGCHCTHLTDCPLPLAARSEPPLDTSSSAQAGTRAQDLVLRPSLSQFCSLSLGQPHRHPDSTAPTSASIPGVSCASSAFPVIMCMPELGHVPQHPFSSCVPFLSWVWRRLVELGGWGADMLVKTKGRLCRQGQQRDHVLVV